MHSHQKRSIQSPRQGAAGTVGQKRLDGTLQAATWLFGDTPICRDMLHWFNGNLVARHLFGGLPGRFGTDKGSEKGDLEEHPALPAHDVYGNAPMGKSGY